MRAALICRASLVALAALLMPVGVLAQSPQWPNQPVRLVVAYPAGGVADIWARIVATPLQRALGQPVLVVNRPGAGGHIGFNSVAKAAPDGYTYIVGSTGPLATSPATQKNQPFDSRKDFTSVGMIGEYGVLFMGASGFAPNTVAEVARYAKANPGKLKFAIGSPGSISHLTSARWVANQGLDVTWIPYKGTAQAMIDLLSGTVDVLIDGLPVALPHAKAGKIKSYAVASRARVPPLPEVPTMAEAGFDGYLATNWISLNAPAGTPRDVLLRLNAELNKVLVDPAVRETFAGQSAVTLPMTVDETQKYILGEIDYWAKVAAETGVKLD